MAKQPQNPVLETMVFINCLQCKKKIGEGYFARYEGGGVCSAKCMADYDKREKFPGHSESDFFKRQRS